MNLTRSPLLGLMIAAALALAPTLQAAPACTEQTEEIAGKLAMRLSSCMINLPGVSNSSQNRSYVISPNGQFMVFNSFGDTGRNSTDTGSRSYFLFPIRQKPSIEKNPISGEVIAHTASGNAVRIDGSGKIVEITGAKFIENAKISSGNRGGVEITYFDGILLDSGWARGGQALEKKAGSSAFKDRHGTKCTVPNAKLFSYKSKYDVQIVFHSNEALARFLKLECPRLDLSPLFARPVSGPAESAENSESASGAH